MSDEDLKALVEFASEAADRVALSCTMMTAASRTRAQVQAALEMAIGNGLITITPRDQWPEWIVLDPPYRLPDVAPANP